MNLIFHKFKTDVRHFRLGLGMFWLILAGPWLGVWLDETGRSAGVFALAMFLEFLVGAFLIAQLVQADALVGTTSFWQTRPTRRLHLFCCKTGFLLLLLLLPFLIVQSLIWMGILGFSFGLWAKSIFEYAVITSAITFAVATAAALTRNARQFLLFCLGVLVGLLCLVALQSELSRGTRSYGIYGDADRTITMWVALLVAMGAAWIVQTLRNAPRISLAIFIAGLLLAIAMQNEGPFFHWLRPPPAKQVALTLKVLGTADSLDEQPGSQVLWSHFRSIGLGEHEFASVRSLSGRFQGEQFWASILSDATPTNFNYRGWLGDDQAQTLTAIQKYYPSNTLWFGNLSRHRQTTLQLQQSRGQTTSLIGGTNPPANPPAGRFAGAINLTIFDMQKVADLPLKVGAAGVMAAGEHMHIRQVAPGPDGIKIKLSRTQPSLWLLPKEPVQYGNALPNENDLVYVLFEPAMGEAFCVRPEANPNSSSEVTLGAQSVDTEISIPFPALRARLAGIGLQDWLRSAHLQIYRPVNRGYSRARFDETNYVFSPDHSPQERKTSDAMGMAAIREAVLPQPHTDAQLRTYVATIAANLPISLDTVDAQTVNRMLSAVGTDDLPVLVQMLPLDSRFESAFVRPWLRKIAVRELLPDLLVALRRDPELAVLFREKGWEPDARDTVISMLPDHGAPLPSDAILIAASAKDANTYPDLAWHFIHQPSYSEEVFLALKQCPGFDVTDAVRQAWKLAQLNLRPKDPLCLAAAAEGLPDALDESILALERRPQNAPLFLNQLATLTDYQGPKAELQSWLSQHLGQFHYDSARRRYTSSQ